MSNQRYRSEFNDEAVRQIVDRGYSVVDQTITQDNDEVVNNTSNESNSQAFAAFSDYS